MESGMQLRKARNTCHPYVRFVVDPRPTEATAASFAAFILEVTAPLEHGDATTLRHLLAYIMRLRERMHCCSSCFVLAGVYVRRFLQRSSAAAGHGDDVVLERRHCILLLPELQRLSLIALVVAAKYLDDVFHTNSHYAKVGGLSVAELNALEQRFLTVVQYKLYVNEQDFAAQLRTHNTVLVNVSPLLMPENVPVRRRPATDHLSKTSLEPYDQSRRLRLQAPRSSSQTPAAATDAGCQQHLSPVAERPWSSKLVHFVGVPVAAVMAAAERASNVTFPVKLKAKA